MKAMVAERGPITIPKRLCDKLGIRSGTLLEFSTRNGALIAHKAETDPVSSVYGCLKPGMSTDRFIRERCGDAGK